MFFRTNFDSIFARRFLSFGAFFGLLVVGFLLLLPAHANAAASLYLAPSSGSFTIGSTFTVSVYVNTGGQAVNAVEANLSFPDLNLSIRHQTKLTRSCLLSIFYYFYQFLYQLKS